MIQGQKLKLVLFTQHAESTAVHREGFPFESLSVRLGVGQPLISHGNGAWSHSMLLRKTTSMKAMAVVTKGEVAIQAKGAEFRRETLLDEMSV